MSPTRNSIAHHVRVSSVDAISYAVSPAGASAGTSEAIQTIVTGRKCWKTIKGKGEVVWPPHLEAALVQGLERYRPVDTRSARALGRFPMRNKFISDYIFEITGVRRTPKQVGSRLQQLRDTCEGKRILKLLTHRPDDYSSSPHDGNSPSPSEPLAPTPPRDFVTLYVLPPHAPWMNVASTSSNSLDHLPRPLRHINNLVTFRSARRLSAYSVSRVLCNGQPVYTEHTELEHTQTQTQMNTHYASDFECLYLYSTKLAPSYWQSLCDVTDIGSYSIVQDIVRSPSPTSSPAMGEEANSEVLFSVHYQFYIGHPNSPPQSPMSSNGDGYSVSSESSPDSTTDLDDLAMLHTLSETSLSTPPPPHSPYAHAYRHTSHSHSNTNRRMYDPSMPPPPALVRDGGDGDDGYASSLPTSPLDLTFGSVHGSMAPPPSLSLPPISAGTDTAGVHCGPATTSFADVPPYATSFDVHGLGFAHSPPGQYVGY
ncbi:hypothetical protein BDW22DRAFT_1180315 [Trametopsis cervina]|nr:hypothetical protein BDW22DRAFT_1180315 [Trametopsis cervina]